MQFRSYEALADKFVLVHCTHGYNRTGYMIVRFLVDTLSISVTEVGTSVALYDKLLFAYNHHFVFIYVGLSFM